MPQSARKTAGRPTGKSEPLRLPVEVEVYVEPDGSVVFADLEAGMARVAQTLEPDTEQTAQEQPSPD